MFYFHDDNTRGSSHKTELALKIRLVEPKFQTGFSLEKALHDRRTVRNFSNNPLKAENISQLLWAGQGISDESVGLRTAPSAGATYPLKLYLSSFRVEDLDEGIYKYVSGVHSLEKIAEGDKRNEIFLASFRQSSVKLSAAIIFITVFFENVVKRYGDRGIRYAYMEAGHAAQNISLEAVSLGLGSVLIGAFHDTEIKNILDLPEGEFPVYLIGIGKLPVNKA